MKFNWFGKVGRKYTAQILLFVASTVFCSVGIASFTEWASFNVLVFFGYGIMNLTSEKKFGKKS